jgi:hypothetical protein
VQIATASACIVLLCTVGFARSNHPSFVVDQWFDSYGDLAWRDEKARLDNFAIALRQDPDLLGYILIYDGRRACVNEARNRGLRAKKYLGETRGIQASRIKLIDGGYREELTVILQPSPFGAPKLGASPTLKRSEVKIIRNCKQEGKRKGSRADSSRRYDYARSLSSTLPGLRN